jgi:hypothetical protein
MRTARRALLASTFGRIETSGFFAHGNKIRSARRQRSLLREWGDLVAVEERRKRGAVGEREIFAHRPHDQR